MTRLRRERRVVSEATDVSLVGRQQRPDRVSRSHRMRGACPKIASRQWADCAVAARPCIQTRNTSADVGKIWQPLRADVAESAYWLADFGAQLPRSRSEGIELGDHCSDLVSDSGDCSCLPRADLIAGAERRWRCSSRRYV